MEPNPYKGIAYGVYPRFSNTPPQIVLIYRTDRADIIKEWAFVKPGEELQWVKTPGTQVYMGNVFRDVKDALDYIEANSQQPQKEKGKILVEIKTCNECPHCVDRTFCTHPDLAEWQYPPNPGGNIPDWCPLRG